MGRSITITVSTLTLLAAVSCTDVGDYSTTMGECYEGEIIPSDFVRQGFETETTLSLAMNTNALGNGTPQAGYLSSSDGAFVNAPVSQMEQLSHDSLSLLQFPGGRVRNYLTHAQPNEGSPALVVISLMENEEVEVRILRPASDDESTSLFGVFRMILNDACDPPGFTGN